MDGNVNIATPDYFPFDRHYGKNIILKIEDRKVIYSIGPHYYCAGFAVILILVTGGYMIFLSYKFLTIKSIIQSILVISL